MANSAPSFAEDPHAPHATEGSPASAVRRAVSATPVRAEPASVFNRRMVIDVPLYTAPLALLLLGVGWQLDSAPAAADLALCALAGLVISAIAVAVRRLLPSEEVPAGAQVPGLAKVAALLAFGTVTALIAYIPISTIDVKIRLNSDSGFDFSDIAVWAAIIFYFIARIVYASSIVYFTIFYILYTLYLMIFVRAAPHIVSVTGYGYISFIIGSLIPAVLVTRSWERSVLGTGWSPVAIALSLTLLWDTLWQIPLISISSISLAGAGITFFLFSLSYIIRRRNLKNMRSNSLGIKELYNKNYFYAQDYAILPISILTLLIILALELFIRIEGSIFPLLSMCFLYSTIFTYAFLFATPLPRLLIEAERRGNPVPGASYADFRRLSRLGVPEGLSRRDAAAAAAAAFVGLARWLRALPVRVSPWIAVPLVSALFVPPSFRWIEGVSPACLALPIAVWAAARWGRRAMAPLVVALLPHVVGTLQVMDLGSLAPQASTSQPVLLGAPGFVAASLFWARFTADGDLRRCLLTQECFGAGALLALAALAGCIATVQVSPAWGMGFYFITNLDWTAVSVVLVWGLSRAPIGPLIGAILVLAALHYMIYDLWTSPLSLFTPLQMSFGQTTVGVEVPAFGLSFRWAAGLVLLALLARFALRQGMSPDARRQTRFSSPLARTAGGVLAVALAVAGLNPGSSSANGVPTTPGDPVLFALGFVIGLWLPRSARRIPRDLLLDWAPLGVLAGISLMLGYQTGGTAGIASVLTDLGRPFVLSTIAAFLAYVVFGHLVRRAAEGQEWRDPPQAPAPAGRRTADALYAGPSAVLDDLVGRDHRVPLVRVIDATFAVPRARRFEEPGVTAAMLMEAAPKPFAEVFAPPAPAAPAAGLVLGGVGKMLLGLTVGLSLLAMTTQIREAGQPSAVPPAASDSPQQIQPQQQQRILPDSPTSKNNRGIESDLNLNSDSNNSQKRSVPASPSTGMNSSSRN